MIKVGIVGCDHLIAAELIRVLINHPDVELMWATGSRGIGERLDAVVPGIVGESDLVVTGEVTTAGVDLIYLCGGRDAVRDFVQAIDLPDDVKIIDLSGSHNQDHGEGQEWKYGLSEMQRRVLVHDARWVTVPGSAAVATLIALLPMARNLLLNSPLSISVAMGAIAWQDGGSKIEGIGLDEWPRDQQQEISLALHQCQSSFGQPISLTVTPLAERRTLAVAVRFKCGVDAETIRQLYEQYYDDHNFVFLIDRPIVTADVENTNKCLISLDKDEHSGDLTVHAVMDLLLKGSAGTAVHAMNLMFGLHERAGLALKGTGC